MPDKKNVKQEVVMYIRYPIEPPTALYCRTAEESNLLDNAGIESQKTRLLRFAEENGYANPKLYIDNGKSGLTLDRPAMKRLITDIKHGRVQTVIVTSANRIARSMEAFAKWTLLLKGKDVKCIAVDTAGEGLSNEFSFWLEVYRSLCPELFHRESAHKYGRTGGS